MFQAMPIEIFSPVRVLSQPEFHAIDERVMRIFLDLLFDQGALLEAKTAETFAPAHRNQTLTYLFLLGLHHARLVNLRPEKVEYEFVSTRLTPEKRKQFTVFDGAWQKVNAESLW